MLPELLQTYLATIERISHGPQSQSPVYTSSTVAQSEYFCDPD